jgi:hypothetical protein
VLAARFNRDLLEEVINATGCREKRKRLPHARDDPLRDRDESALR